MPLHSTISAKPHTGGRGGSLRPAPRLGHPNTQQLTWARGCLSWSSRKRWLCSELEYSRTRAKCSMCLSDRRSCNVTITSCKCHGQAWVRGTGTSQEVTRPWQLELCQDEAERVQSMSPSDLAGGGDQQAEPQLLG